VPAGKRVLARNTFFRDFVAAPELANRYAAVPGAAIHYVSGGPWQLYRPLAAFIGPSGFPEGSFHMRVAGGSLLTAMQSLEDLGNFVSADGTFDHKVEQITRIMTRFPARMFILIGDSGEKDPEVYSTIRSRFAAQVQEIVIRDIVNARETARERLTGMTVISAPTVVAAGSLPQP
jgi:phosphatidate phosphatase APP1